MNQIAIYIHWPFCKSKCPYCDFNSHVRDKIEQRNWLAAYIKELDYFKPRLEGKVISSIFFGGGTPSLMEPFIVEGLISYLNKNYLFDKNVEITLEANPTSVEAEKFRNFRNVGINRVSIGVQALNENDLKFLGREHNEKEALNAIRLAGEIFPRFSFDLIYARPGQSLNEWEIELKRAISMAKGHLSLYQLTIEKGTPFYSLYNAKKFSLPDEEVAAEMYELTDSLMNDAGMPAYEVSNYASNGHESRHNMTYWNYGEYLGIGPGAHSRLKNKGGREALMMIHNPESWLNSINEKGHGIQTNENITGKELVEEVFMMGLRLTEGLKLKNFEEITGYKLEMLVPEEKFMKLIKDGLIIKDNSVLRATPKGRLLLNSIIGYLS